MKCVISVLGKDRSGVVAAIATTLADCGANIDDISQTILGEGRMFSMTMMVTLDPAVADFNTVQERLAADGERLSMQCPHPARGRLPSDVRDLERRFDPACARPALGKNCRYGCVSTGDCAATVPPPEIPAARLLDRCRCPSPALEASLKPTRSEQKSTFSKTSYRFSAHSSICLQRNTSSASCVLSYVSERFGKCAILEATIWKMCFSASPIFARTRFCPLFHNFQN